MKWSLKIIRKNKTKIPNFEIFLHSGKFILEGSLLKQYSVNFQWKPAQKQTNIAQNTDFRENRMHPIIQSIYSTATSMFS